MTYPEFIQELTERFGDEGIVIALRAEVGFLRRYLEKQYGADFQKAQEEMIEDFLTRHPKN